MACLCSCGVGEMLEGRGGLHTDVGDAQGGGELLQDCCSCREVIRPDRPCINKASAQAFVGREAIFADELQGCVAGCAAGDATEVQTNSRNGEGDDPGVCRLCQVIIAANKVDGETYCCKLGIGGLVDSTGSSSSVCCQGGLKYLDFWAAQGVQLAQELPIGW